MKLNHSKSKFIVFNPSRTHDFIPEFKSEDTTIETVESLKLLGITLSNDLTWDKNTHMIVKKAYSRLWMLRRLKGLGANANDLKDIYIKQIRSLLEFGVPVWNPNLTQQCSKEIERVQKATVRIILGNNFLHYREALDVLGLETLKIRRTKLCLKFARKSAKHPRHSSWFIKDTTVRNIQTRSKKPTYKPPVSRLDRFKRSPIPYLTNLLNSN